MAVLCGEIAIEPRGEGFRLSHREEGGTTRRFTIGQARELALFDEAGKFRPLKTAPTLRRGWEILARDWAEAESVLDQFYPGRLPVWQRLREERLRSTPLRETLGRQTGMYRAAAKISDDQISSVVEHTCNSEACCLRKILWRRDDTGAYPSAALPPEKYEVAEEEGSIPMICQEACALLLGACREAVRR